MADTQIKNILFIAHSPDFYGADKVLYQVIDKIRNSFNVHVVLPGPGEMQGRLEKLSDVELSFLPLPRFSLAGKDIGANVVTFLPFSRAFKKLLTRLKPDLVYGNTVRSVIPVALARRFGYRTLVHFHEHNVPGKAGSLIAKLANRASDRNIFVCRSALESYAVFSPDLNRKSRVIYNGIDPMPTKGDLSMPQVFQDREPRLLSVGQLASHKRIGDLLEAMPAILAVYPSAMLVILGEGDSRQELENSIKELGLADNVSLPGYVTDILPLLSAADMFLAPFEKEACNMAVIEAMAAAKPVVASHGGGMPELVEEGVTGYLYPTGDIVQLTERILHLAGLKELQERFGEAASLRVKEKFNLDSQVKKIIHEIETGIGGGEE